MSTIQTRQGKSGTTYRVEAMRNGVRISKSFKKKKEAQTFSALMLVDDNLVHSLTNHTLTTLKLSDAAQLFLKQDKGRDPSKQQRINFWVSKFGNLTVGKITRQQVKAELQLLSHDKAPATLNRYKSALGSLYRFLSNEYEIDYNPVKGIPQYAENNARTRFLTEQEVQKLLNKAKNSQWQQLYLLILMAITTGARRTEILSLKWEYINFKAKTAHLPQTKNGEQRILTLTQDVIAELMRYRNLAGYVFAHPEKTDDYFHHFDLYWRTALKEAGIIDFRFHDLRHTCASMLAMNGASLLEIAQVLGHKSITMTQRYSHLCVEHKANLTDRVFGGIVNG